MAKLTLEMDKSVVARAKGYAARRGISVSLLVEELLSQIVSSTAREDEEIPPVLARLRAELRASKADRADYRRYLGRKYH